MSAPFVEPLRRIVECLDALGVPFLVGGSLASVLHGEIRTTQDADIVIELREERVPDVAASLQGDFFVDEEALRDAVRRRSSCNVIHRATAFKIDLFARRDRPFSESEMARRQRVEVGGIRLPIATAEDCVLTKLEWFEKGGRVSDRQWRDVLGVLKAQAGRLEIGYLRRWAAELAASELLERALQEAGVGG